jgi:gas vesicle protein GvpL/GvpF
MWYVFALVDAPPGGRIGRGLRGPLRTLEVPGGYAIVERRADVPPPEFGSLRAHQRTIERLAKAVPAILPVRFGTLLQEDALDPLLTARDADLAEAFALVRHRVQFTWRRVPPTRNQVRRARRPGRGSEEPGAGAAYLHRAAADAMMAPAVFRAARETLHAFVVRDRFQAASPGMPDTLYHLTEKTAQQRYRTLAEALVLATPALTFSGPWPPFAFAPEVL